MQLVYADFYAGYVSLVKEYSLEDALTNTMKEYQNLMNGVNEDAADYRYAENKWTIRQVAQHIVDAERVFMYRANAFARNETAHLPSFDEDAWAEATAKSKRKLNDILLENDWLRKSNILFFNSLTPEELERKGIASTKEINAIALGYIIAGHQQHHINILKERYLINL